MILDIVIRSTRKLFGNVRPPITMVFVKSNENRLFVVSPLSFLEGRIQMIDKTLATLFPLTTRQVGSNLGPFSTIEFTFRSQDIVFFRSPRTLSFDDWRLSERLPLGETVDCRSFREVGSNIVPTRRCYCNIRETKNEYNAE